MITLKKLQHRLIQSNNLQAILNPLWFNQNLLTSAWNPPNLQNHLFREWRSQKLNPSRLIRQLSCRWWRRSSSFVAGFCPSSSCTASKFTRSRNPLTETNPKKFTRTNYVGNRGTQTNPQQHLAQKMGIEHSNPA